MIYGIQIECFNDASLSIAVKHGHTETVITLLSQQNIDVNIKDIYS